MKKQHILVWSKVAVMALVLVICVYFGKESILSFLGGLFVGVFLGVFVLLAILANK